jgi:hypothetical protein
MRGGKKKREDGEGGVGSNSGEKEKEREAGTRMKEGDEGGGRRGREKGGETYL